MAYTGLWIHLLEEITMYNIHNSRKCIALALFVCGVVGYIIYLKSKTNSQIDGDLIYPPLSRHREELKSLVDNVVFKYHKQMVEKVSSSLSKHHDLLNNTFHTIVKDNMDNKRIYTNGPSSHTLIEKQRSKAEFSKHQFDIPPSTGKPGLIINVNHGKIK